MCAALIQWRMMGAPDLPPAFYVCFIGEVARNVVCPANSNEVALRRSIGYEVHGQELAKV